jgi:hypothetical protein
MVTRAGMTTATSAIPFPSYYVHSHVRACQGDLSYWPSGVINLYPFCTITSFPLWSNSYPE